jgi:hypothetical protein
MSKLIQKRYRMLTLVTLIMILGTASYGFAAANTFVDGGKAGEGSSAVSGYHVTAVKYVLDSNNPNLIDSVSFTLDNSATSVYAGLDDGTLLWRGCTTTDNINFSCDFSTDTVSTSGLATLHVAAGQ